MHFACCPIKVLYCSVSFSFISRREEGTAVEVALIFNGTSSETLPSTDDVAETLIRAVTDPDSTLTTQFNVTVAVDSIRVLNPTTSTTSEAPSNGSTVPAANTIAPVTATPTAFTSIATGGISNSAGNATTVADSTSVINPTTSTTPEVPATGSPLPAATTTVPTQVLILQATLEVPFVPALENSQSTEYQDLATTVIGFYDAIFSSQYGLLFERTEVRSFSRREEGTAVEVALIFNGTSSETLPSTDDVAETLIRAVTDPDSTLTTQFNVTVAVDSIRVLTTTTVPTQVLILQATLEVPFVPALENSQSTEYQDLATTVIGFYDAIFSSQYGLLFERTEVRSFSRREEGTAVEVALIFNGTSSETLPSTDDVAETLIRAVTDPDSTLTTQFNVTVAVDSIRVLILALEVTLVFPFEPALEDNQSPQFKALAAQIVALCDAIYRGRYGLFFIRTVVRAFRPLRVRMLGTDVEADLIFNTTMPEALPSNEDVKKTLQSAVTNPNSTITSEFNITVVAESIRVMSVNTSTTPSTKLTTASVNTSTTPSTKLTTASVANASTTTKVKLTTAKATTRATTTPSSAKPATAAPTSASTATPSAIVQIEFTSRETFVPDLLNQNSKAFQARSKLTKEQIEPIFRRAFSSFIQLNIRSFREGSIVTNADMTFKSSESLPSNDQILSTLRNAILNSQISFDIDPDSIKLTSAISSGVSDMTSVLTASSLAMVSLLLSHCW
ncbi:hypothetical protein ANANG_G00316380 [Anguilla anguilla]|uniref:SEA domain-containing protein n=1 Tax=Anguilla anguilla TaxID=7936 RepID=A0A9D3LIW8_ANGAN|nr:hypothetical protein ANANG_G00316380 [Anguilla anguilla]